MTFVVTESCIKCKLTDCVEVCPVDCFHEGPNFLVIDPDECIDCTLCEPECPVEAIYSEDELPAGDLDYQDFIRPPTRTSGGTSRTSSSTWRDSAGHTRAAQPVAATRSTTQRASSALASS